MKTTNRKLRFAIAAPLIGALVVAGSGSATNRDGCETLAANSIHENAEFTPYEEQLSHLPDFLILGEDEATRAVPDTARFDDGAIDGLERQHSVWIEPVSVYAWFLDQPLDGITWAEFAKLGGIQLLQDAAVKGEPFAEFVVKEFGSRATAVMVGPHPGVVTWADPLGNGVRTHNVYWSDGTSEFAVIADLPAEQVLGLARTLECRP